MFGPRGRVVWTTRCDARWWTRKHRAEVVMWYVGSAEGSPYPRTDRPACPCGARWSVDHKAWYRVIPPTPDEVEAYNCARRDLAQRLRVRMADRGLLGPRNGGNIEA